MPEFLHALVRISAFLRKEVTEVLRQPRLILTLVLGPFLILFLFGVGYQNQARSVKALFVVKEDNPIAPQVQAYAATLGNQLQFSGITPDLAAAMDRLRQGQVDLVVVAPDDVNDTLLGNHQAVFQVYHAEIDPSQASYLDYLGKIYIDEVNRRVMTVVTRQLQQRSDSVLQDIQTARDDGQLTRQALQAGDAQSAQQGQQKMLGSVDHLEANLGVSIGLLSGIPDGSSGKMAALLATMADLKKNTAAPQASPAAKTEVERLDRADTDLAALSQQIAAFKAVSPDVIVRPFTVETHAISAEKISSLDFFTPAVIALLLQHIAVTIASLSIVSERRSGALELFRVSPISSFETILGKYFSYLLFGALIGAVLTALVCFGLRIPMLGSWAAFALVGITLLFASLGLGFVISLMARTESQAVQFAMISLLMSVFFSGFLLDLRYFILPVRIVAYFLPVTYGIDMLQGIMLRGAPIDPLWYAGLLSIGVVLFFFT
jgi:ABC-2 type transport system permease protein